MPHVAVDDNGTLVLSPSGEASYLVEPSPLPVPRLVHIHMGRKAFSAAPELPDSQFFAATVIDLQTEATGVGAVSLDRRMSFFLKDADFEKQFLHVVVILLTKAQLHRCKLPSDVRAVLERFGCKAILAVSPDRAFSISEGPYFVRDRRLHRIWKLFPDTYDAFEVPVIQILNSDK